MGVHTHSISNGKRVQTMIVDNGKSFAGHVTTATALAGPVACTNNAEAHDWLAALDSYEFVLALLGRQMGPFLELTRLMN